MKEKKAMFGTAHANLVQVVMAMDATTIGTRFSEGLPSTAKLSDSSNDFSTETFAQSILKMWKATQETESQQAVQSTSAWKKVSDILSIVT